MVDIAERLALIIDAKTSGAVTELRKTVKSAEDLTVAQDRAALSSAKMSAAQDKLAASLAKQQVAEAKATGDTTALAKAQTASAAASEKANLSKAQAAIASDKLRVSQLAAKDASAALGSEAVATGGLLDKLGLSSISLSGALTTLGPLFAFAAIGVGIKLLTDGIRHFEQLTDQVRKFEQITGASATQASLLVGQLKGLGVDPDTAAKAFGRFGAAIGDGTSKINEFGVATAHNKDGTVDLVGTLDNLRAAYQGSTDAATRDAIAKQLGLRNATALLPLLNATKQQINDLNKATKASGGIVSNQDVNNALQLKIASNEMKEAFANLELGLSRNFIPLLAQGADLAAKTAESVNWWTKKAGDIVFAPEHFLKGIFHPGDQGDGNKAKAAAQLAVESAQKEKDAEDKLTQSLTGELSAKRAVRDATQSLADARQNEIDAQDKLNFLLFFGAVNAKDVANATKDLANASKAVTRAQEAEGDAVKELNKARERATALELSEAQNKIALAGDRIGTAKAAEQQAQEKLDALLGSGDATKGQVAAAQAELKTRHDEVTQAVNEQADATDNLAKVKQKGTDADPAVISAERNVRDAHDRVTDAIDNQKDALAKLHTAEAGDPEWAKKVAAARKDLAKAHQDIADAQDNQVIAALGLKTATDQMNTSLDGTATTLENVIGQFKDLKAQGLNVDQILGLLGVTPGAGAWGLPTSITHPTLSGHRAKGGPLEPFGAYLVAEPGTGGEIIQMGGQRGYATPAGHSGSTFVTNVTAETNASAAEIAREVSWSLRTTVLPRIAA